MTGITPDAWLGALTAILAAVTAGVVKLIITTTRTETLLRAHLEDRRAHPTP